MFKNEFTAQWFLLGGNDAPKAPRGNTSWEDAARWTTPPFASRWRSWLAKVNNYIGDCLKIREAYAKLPLNRMPVLVDAGGSPTRWTGAAAEARRVHKAAHGGLPLEEALA